MTDKRFALLIANTTYEDVGLRQLVAPVQDAEDLGRVLGDPAIGGFEVHTLLNKSSHEVRLAIEGFYTDRGRDDLLLLYFSGHGIKDEDGQLYFATTNTLRKFLRSTSVEAHFINEMMRRSCLRRQVLLLDCCYSGAFARGMIAKADEKIGTREQFEGRGRVILTASDAMQYSFEGDAIIGQGVRSVFTRILVQGLETEEADLDEDGRISLDELYNYVYDRMMVQTPQQRPGMWAFDIQGKIFIAQFPDRLARPIDLPVIPPPTPDFMAEHYKQVVEALANGRLVLWLGEEINLYGRPVGLTWQPSQFDYLPSSLELATYLAREFRYPASEPRELARVSQYIRDEAGPGRLYRALHSVFDADYPLTPYHQFFATLPAVFREKGYPRTEVEDDYLPRHFLIMTTNYDDVLERAFRTAGEPFHLMSYVAEGNGRGKFLYWPPEGKPFLIKDKSLGGHDEYPIIMKIHGTVDRVNAKQDSFVIAEDHYMDSMYSLRTYELPYALQMLLPITSFLFLGYSHRASNLRACLKALPPWKVFYASWLITSDPQDVGQEFWKIRKVAVLNVALDSYIRELSVQVQALPRLSR